MITRDSVLAADREFDSSPEEEDAEWERWMSLTDEEQEAEEQAAMREMEKICRARDDQRARMPRRQLARLLAREHLEACLLSRERIDRFATQGIPSAILDTFRKSLRWRQRELLHIRKWRVNGPVPGRGY